MAFDIKREETLIAETESRLSCATACIKGKFVRRPISPNINTLQIFLVLVYKDE